MSNKKLVYFLMVSLVYGLIAGGVAHGQSTGTFTIEGTVMNAAGEPAAGLQIEADTISEFIPYTSRDNGAYVLGFLSFTNAQISVGDQIRITATDSDGSEVGRTTYTVTAADVNANNATVDITLSVISVEPNPSVLPADGVSTSTITIMVQEDGNPVTGDTVMVSADKGDVTEATEGENGVYTATYTAPSLALTAPDVAQLSVRSTQLDQEVMESITLMVVPTTVTVTVDLDTFSADTPETAAVTVMVNRGATRVTDETVTLALSRNDGGSDMGMVSEVTNNEDGAYAATYTSGGMVGNVTLTAMATQAGVSGMTTISINAGPPVAIMLSANPVTVSSERDSIITATVMDSVGNGVGGLSLAAIPSGDGMLTPFMEAAEFGVYTATYSAPVVDADGTEMITVMTVMADSISEQLTLNLTPIPPKMVTILVVEGVVYKEDGEVPADDVNVMVTVGANPPQMDQTKEDGSFSVAVADLLGGAAAGTGELVSIVVTDDTGAEHGPYMSVLTHEDLGEEDSATVTFPNVVTDIVIPPRSVTILVVEGGVTKAEGTVPVEGVDVTVTVGANSPQMDQTEVDGSFSVAVVNLLGAAGSTGDMVSVVVTDSTGKERGSEMFMLTNTQLGEGDSATVTQNVDTDIASTSTALAVSGTVYLKNGDGTKTPAASNSMEGELTVVVTNNTRDMPMSGSVDADGKYSVLFFTIPSTTVAETDNQLTVEVKNDADETVETAMHTLTSLQIEANQVQIDVDTDLPAITKLLAIVGSVVNVDGTSAGPGVGVTLRLQMNGIGMEAKTVTDADGGYRDVFLDLLMPVAATDNMLTIDLLQESTGFIGRRVIELRSQQVISQNQPLAVEPIMLVPPTLKLGGLSINPEYALGRTIFGMLTSIIKDLASGFLPPGEMLPPELFDLPGLLPDLPAGFDSTNDEIDMENFGNAITPKPIWHVVIEDEQADPRRWLNGDALNLYVIAGPTANNVTFMLSGSHSETVEAVRVGPGDTFKRTFRLEEELAAIFFPSGDMPIFSSATLMMNGQPSPMTLNQMGVWEAEAYLAPGSKVSYYYQVDFANPYSDPLTGETISSLSVPDLRNLQLEGLEIFANLLTTALNAELALDNVLDPLITAMDPKMALKLMSVFTVPEVDELQSLWVGGFDLTDAPDGTYQLDTAVEYAGNYGDEITGQMFTVDRTAPTAEAMLTLDMPGENASMYQRTDGVYVATADPTTSGNATLNITATPMGDLSDLASYLSQIIPLNDDGMPAANQIWLPVTTLEGLPSNQIPIRDEMDNSLTGKFGLRTIGIDTILNASSDAGSSVSVDIVPPESDIAEVTRVQADYDGDGMMDGLFEMQYVPDGVTIFSDTMVMLTVEIMKRTAHPLESIVVEFQINGGDWQPITVFSGATLVNAMGGDQFDVMWDIGDFETLSDMRDGVMVRTVATNALRIEGESRANFAYQRRLSPEIAAVGVEATDLHPDSGAPRGEIKIHAFTQGLTAPLTAAVQFEIRRSQDAMWQPIGTVNAEDSTTTNLRDLSDQITVIEDLVDAVLGGASSAAIAPFYRLWSIPLDITTLEDTILDDSPAEDANPYVVRAIAIDVDGAAYEPGEGAREEFSVDNFSPINIIEVTSELGVVDADENGIFIISGLADPQEQVLGPIAVLTAWTGAHPGGFPGGMKLSANMRNPDGTPGDSMDVGDIGFSSSSNFTYTAEIDLGMLPNGSYLLQAVTFDADSNPEERNVSMSIGVDVENFIPSEDFVVVIPGEGIPLLPDPGVAIVSVMNPRFPDMDRSVSENRTAYPTGFPVKDMFTFTLTVQNVRDGEIDVLIGDEGRSAREAGELTIVPQMSDGGMTFTVTLDTSQFSEGGSVLIGEINKQNGSAIFGLPVVNIDKTGPTVAILSPLPQRQLSALPTIRGTYDDGDMGGGIAPADLIVDLIVAIKLTRLVAEEMIDADPAKIHVTQATDGQISSVKGDIVYTREEALLGGAYRASITVTDIAGNEGTAEVEFTIEGGELDTTPPVISGASPQGTIKDFSAALSARVMDEESDITRVTISLNGDDPKEVSIPDASRDITASRDAKFGRGTHSATLVAESAGGVKTHTWTFTVVLDSTPPVISAVAPQGLVRKDSVTLSAVVVDAESEVTSVTLALDGKSAEKVRTPTRRGGGVLRTEKGLSEGVHKVTIAAESQGGTSTHTWTFTVDLDVAPPVITSTAPSGTVRTEKPVISVSATDDRSGIREIIVVVTNSTGTALVTNSRLGVAETDSNQTYISWTPRTALKEDTYTVRATVRDNSKNEASASWNFTVEFDKIPPSVTIVGPPQEARMLERKPMISAAYTDSVSGVDKDSVKLWFDSDRIPSYRLTATASQVTFKPSKELDVGRHTVKIEVSDLAKPKSNTTTQEWSFIVESEEGIVNPRNYPNPFVDGTTIVLTLSKQATITVEIYDITSRLVRQLAQDELWEAGPVAFLWDGKTAEGEALSRGVYFCQITMHSDLKPQTAVLKMALIRNE